MVNWKNGFPPTYYPSFRKKKGRRDFRRFSRPTNPEKCFSQQQQQKNNFHSIFSLKIFTKFLLFSRRCCINDLDGLVRTKGFTTAWRSKDKLLPIPAEELSFREMFPFESQVNFFNFTNFFFREKKTTFISSQHSTKEKKRTRWVLRGLPWR